MSVVKYGAIGFLVFAVTWFFIELMSKGKNKAIVFEENRPVKILKATKVGNNKNLWKFKGGAEKGVSPNKNVSSYKGKHEASYWVRKNGVVAPLTLDLDHNKINFMSVQEQVILADALRKIEAKVKTGWWEKNKEVITGLTLIMVGFVIYMYTIKRASDVDAETANQIANGVGQIVNSTKTTENNINRLVEYIHRD